MQYEIVIKVIGGSFYTCLPRTAPNAAQTGRKTAAPGIYTLESAKCCFGIRPMSQIPTHY